MKRDIWKWINRLFFSGLWLQPFVMAGLIWFFQNVLQGDISYLLLLVLSFLPSVYVWSENQRQAASGKQEFGIEDIFHDRPNQYSSPLKEKAMYPAVDEKLLFDTPQGVVLGCIEAGKIKKQTKYLCKPMEQAAYRDGHVLIIGGSGSGKSSAVILPTLLASRGTGLFCVDIKGELWRKSRRMDEENVLILDFQDRCSWGWDFFYQLNHKANIREQDIKECMADISDALIPIGAKETDQFWKQSARSMLTGLLIGLYKQRGIQNLSELINEILASDVKTLIEQLIDGAAPGAVEVKYLASFRSLAEETFSGVRQQQDEALKIFTDEDIRFACETNGKQANPQMIEAGKQIFLAVKEEKLEAYTGVVNLIISQVFSCLVKRPEGSRPVLVVLDEMARLCARGKIPYLHNGILLTGRSRNITLMMVTQSYEALENAYTKADIQSMTANCSYLVALDVRSQDTAKSICAMAGTYKERETTWSGSGKHRSVSISYKEKNILEPSDLSRLVQKNEAVLISQDFFYNRVKKCSYFKDAILGPQSIECQRYNAEALNLEGKEVQPVFLPELEKTNGGKYIEKITRILEPIKTQGVSWKKQIQAAMRQHKGRVRK